MPIYSETISDKQLKKIISNDVKNVLIIGCGACMNESLAYKNNIPITVDLDSDMPYPYATVYELKRIKSLLSEKCNVETLYFKDINGFLCMNNAAHNDYPIPYTITPDIVLTLCCSAGYEAIKERFPNVRIIKIAKQTAIIYYSFHDENGSRIISKRDSHLLPIRMSNI